MLIQSGRGFRFGELLGLGRWWVETERQGEEEGLEVGSWSLGDGVERDGEKTSSASAETDAQSSSGLLLPQRGPARAVEVERHEVGGRFI